MALTLDITLNKTLRHQIAADAREVTDVVARLPRRVADDLMVELQGCGEAHRYDVSSARAYSFRSEGSTLDIWIWSDVDAIEAGSLLPSLVGLDQGLTETTASDAFFQATGRRVNEPRAYTRLDWFDPAVSVTDTAREALDINCYPSL
jgi:hypothetical protein